MWNVADVAETDTVVAGLQMFSDGSRQGRPDAAIVAVGYPQGLDGLRIAEFVLHPPPFFVDVVRRQTGTHLLHGEVGGVDALGDNADILIQTILLRLG